MTIIARAEHRACMQFKRACLKIFAAFLILVLMPSFGTCLADQGVSRSLQEVRNNKWRIQIAPGNVVQLVFPASQSDLVRISISKADTKIPWHIQLNQDRISVRERHLYILTFRARADRVRNIVAAVSKAHEPWDSLGLYKTIGLTQNWQSFELEFKAIEDDDDARIHFDVGGNGASVELSGVVLRSLPQ